MEAAQVPSQAALADLDALTVCHHLMARAGKELALPHVRQRCSEAYYVAWLDTHSATEVRAALQAALDAYAADVHRHGQKQYTVEYPILVKLLNHDVAH